MNVMRVSANDATENQNDIERTVLPFVVDWLAFVGLGSTYTISFCCR